MSLGFLVFSFPFDTKLSLHYTTPQLQTRSRQRQAAGSPRRNPTVRSAIPNFDDSKLTPLQRHLLDEVFCHVILSLSVM